MEKGKEREKEKGEWRVEMGDGRKKMGEVLCSVRMVRITNYCH